MGSSRRSSRRSSPSPDRRSRSKSRSVRSSSRKYDSSSEDEDAVNILQHEVVWAGKSTVDLLSPYCRIMWKNVPFNDDMSLSDRIYAHAIRNGYSAQSLPTPEQMHDLCTILGVPFNRGQEVLDKCVDKLMGYIKRSVEYKKLYDFDDKHIFWSASLRRSAKSNRFKIDDPKHLEKHEQKSRCFDESKRGQSNANAAHKQAMAYMVVNGYISSENKNGRQSVERMAQARRERSRSVSYAASLSDEDDIATTPKSNSSKKSKPSSGNKTRSSTIKHTKTKTNDSAPITGSRSPVEAIPSRKEKSAILQSIEADEEESSDETNLYMTPVIMKSKRRLPKVVTDQYDSDENALAHPICGPTDMSKDSMDDFVRQKPSRKAPVAAADAPKTSSAHHRKSRFEDLDPARFPTPSPPVSKRDMGIDVVKQRSTRAQETQVNNGHAESDNDTAYCQVPGKSKRQSNRVTFDSDKQSVPVIMTAKTHRNKKQPLNSPDSPAESDNDTVLHRNTPKAESIKCRTLKKPATDRRPSQTIPLRKRAQSIDTKSFLMGRYPDHNWHEYDNLDLVVNTIAFSALDVMVGNWKRSPQEIEQLALANGSASVGKKEQEGGGGAMEDGDEDEEDGSVESSGDEKVPVAKGVHSY